MPLHSSPGNSFDRLWVLDQIGGDEDLLREIAIVFLVDSPDIRQQLNAALQADDAHALHAAAHCAKSAVGNFGARTAVQAAIALEDAAKNGETGRFTEMTGALCLALIEVEDALRQEAA